MPASGPIPEFQWFLLALRSHSPTPTFCFLLRAVFNPAATAAAKSPRAAASLLLRTGESPPPPRSWRPDFLLGAEHVASADRNLRYRENCASVPVLPWVAPRPSGKGGGLCRHMGGVRRGGASWKAEQGVLGRGHFRMSPTGGWGAGRTHCPVIWL